jgi:hypothetical protein
MTARAAPTHYSPADVFCATGISVPKQNQWYDRRTIQPSRSDKQPTGSGSYRLVCPATVYQIAITAKCVDVGIPARKAAEAARLFAISNPDRGANALYEFGRTLLIYKATGAQILNADFNASLTDICGRPFETAIIVDIGQTIRAVDEALAKLKKDNK